MNRPFYSPITRPVSHFAVGFFAAAFAALLLVVAADAAKPKMYGSIAKANAAARNEVYQVFFWLDPTLRDSTDGPVAFEPGCRRLTVRAFRCDWSADDASHYSATGVVRVTFQPFGVDAVLAPGWSCVPQGGIYEQVGMSECPDG